MPDAIAISETNLNANSSSNLNFTNYKFIRNDSITRAGGIGFYIKDSLRSTLRKTYHLFATLRRFLLRSCIRKIKHYFKSNLSPSKAKNIVISR